MGPFAGVGHQAQPGLAGGVEQAAERRGGKVDLVAGQVEADDAAREAVDGNLDHLLGQVERLVAVEGDDQPHPDGGVGAAGVVNRGQHPIGHFIQRVVLALGERGRGEAQLQVADVVARGVFDGLKGHPANDLGRAVKAAQHVELIKKAAEVVLVVLAYLDIRAQCFERVGRQAQVILARDIAQRGQAE